MTRDFTIPSESSKEYVIADTEIERIVKFVEQNPAYTYTLRFTTTGIGNGIDIKIHDDDAQTYTDVTDYDRW